MRKELTIGSTGTKEAPFVGSNIVSSIRCLCPIPRCSFDPVNQNVMPVEK